MFRIRGFIAVLSLIGAWSLVHAAEAGAVSSWTDRIKISGDFRYRYEFIGQELYNSAAGTKVRDYDRNRNRIRFRLGMQAMVNSDIDGYFRLATSQGDDPVSTNQDLSGGFVPKAVWIDRAYMDFHPHQVKWLEAIAGRQPVPFEPSVDELVWDADLNLEGVTALLNLRLVAAFPVILELPADSCSHDMPWVYEILLHQFRLKPRWWHN